MRLDLLKTASFDVLHFSVGFGVTYALTGSVAISTGVALIEPAVNTVVFFFHERIWQRATAAHGRKAAIPRPRGRCLGHSAGAWGLPRGALAKPQD